VIEFLNRFQAIFLFLSLRLDERLDRVEHGLLFEGLVKAFGDRLAVQQADRRGVPGLVALRPAPSPACSIYHKGWTAVTNHSTPWEMGR
jgi:hypothetical protein